MNKLVSLRWLIIGLILIGCNPFGVARSSEGDIAQFVPPPAPASTGVVASQAEGEALVRLEPATAQLNVGNTLVVEVRVENVTDMYAASFDLLFNPAILQVQDEDSGKDGVQIQPGNFPNPEFVATNTANNTTGLIQYAVTQLGDTAPVSGNGLLAAITFQTVAQGSSDLVFNQVMLVNKSAALLSSTSENGQIVVGEAGGPTPTFTVTSTLAPGQPTPTPTSTPTLLPTSPTPANTSTPVPPPTATFTPIPTPTNTPVTPAVQIPAGATVGFCYRVQPGETLAKLGQDFKINPRFISLANDLNPPGHIYAQQVLFIPEQYGSGPNVYKVQPGDTITVIAERCQLDVSYLAQINNLPQAANLEKVGFLIIPRPLFPPPSRYPYPPSGPSGPPSVWPQPCCGLY